MLISLFKHNIVFSNRELFLEYAIDFVPTENNPRSQNKEKKSYNKPENSRIKKNRYTENQTNSSKENHKAIIMSLL